MGSVQRLGTNNAGICTEQESVVEGGLLLQGKFASSEKTIEG
jgi:hypothetical protein